MTPERVGRISGFALFQHVAGKHAEGCIVIVGPDGLTVDDLYEHLHRALQGNRLDGDRLVVLLVPAREQ